MEAGMTRLNCSHCGGEGQLYDSKYGGNDPDVWPTGECPACKGSANQICENRGCEEDAVAFDEDGKALCMDCLMEWQMQEFGN
jgi:hypothetical protein